VAVKREKKSTKKKKHGEQKIDAPTTWIKTVEKKEEERMKMFDNM